MHFIFIILSLSFVVNADVFPSSVTLSSNDFDTIIKWNNNVISYDVELMQYSHNEWRTVCTNSLGYCNLTNSDIDNDDETWVRFKYENKTSNEHNIGRVCEIVQITSPIVNMTRDGSIILLDIHHPMTYDNQYYIYNNITLCGFEFIYEATFIINDTIIPYSIDNQYCDDVHCLFYFISQEPVCVYVMGMEQYYESGPKKSDNSTRVCVDGLIPRKIDTYFIKDFDDIDRVNNRLYRVVSDKYESNISSKFIYLYNNILSSFKLILQELMVNTEQ
ncbi:interferon gamma receptor-like protein [Swinepox virus]|uniref:Interferon gamma receptor-like protein n=1 Tax=Swinepox virus TaxID=10276 RepID=A0A881SXY5_SWPV|nr:interferon gamma receptor-like protein [Swinepox virus]